MATNIPAERVVKFLFEGLFFFSFPEDTGNPEIRSEGRVGILSIDPSHELEITYVDSGICRKIRLPHATVRGLSEEIVVRKTTSGEEGVSILGGWTRPSVASVPLEPTEELPFGLIVNFEGDELHGPDFPRETPKTRGRIHPRLIFKTGTFYTEKQSDDRFEVVRGGVSTPLGHIAEVIGVKITLTDVERLEISGLPPVPETVTTIRLEHVCPQFVRQGEDGLEEREIEPSQITGSDDMQMYYEYLSIPKNMAFNFRQVGARGAPPAICYSGGGSRTFD